MSSGEPSYSETLERLVSLAETPEQMDAAQILWEIHTEKEADKSFCVESLSEVASFFGLAEPTVRQWTQRDPPIPGKAGAWPLRDIVQWREAWLTQADLQARSRQQAFELGEVKLASERLELAEKRRQLLDRDDVEHWAGVAMVEFRETVMQLKEMLTASAPPEMKDFVRAETDRHLRDALTTVARRLELAQIEESE